VVLVAPEARQAAKAQAQMVALAAARLGKEMANRCNLLGQAIHQA